MKGYKCSITLTRVYVTCSKWEKSLEHAVMLISVPRLLQKVLQA